MTATTPLAIWICPTPAACLLVAIGYFMASRHDVDATTEVAALVVVGAPHAHSWPDKPDSAPRSANVRTPAKRAAGPDAWPDHWRSTPTAAPPSVATARARTDSVGGIMAIKHERAQE